MSEILTDLVADVRSSKKLPDRDKAPEEEVKQSVIEPVLDALGWTTSSIEEVEREYTVEGVGSVDYVLRLKGENKVFLEAKRSSARLDDYATQLRDYVAEETVPLAVLTNGLEWWFYLPPRRGTWRNRRFCTIDLLIGDIPSIVAQLTHFLSKENIESGEAVKNADIHRAWQVLIAPDDSLVRLFGKKIEEMGGWQPDQDEIKRFLANLPKPAPASPNLTSHPLASPTTKQPKQNSGSYDGTKLVRFIFHGQTYGARPWSRLLTTLAEQVYQLHSSEFEKALELRGNKHPYFRRDPQGMKNPKRIGNSGYFVDTNLTPNMIVQRCHALLDKFGYSPDDLQIETA